LSPSRHAGRIDAGQELVDPWLINRNDMHIHALVALGGAQSFGGIA
jgi:hypothetical protein